MENSLNELMTWLQANSEWLSLAVFLTALLETLVLVGLILPGVVMLFALASLAGSGALDIWTVMIWAFAGAVLGDTISYSLGYRFHDRIKSWWPFRLHPEWINSGERFFLKYGGLSVAIGRFVGPIRPIIPLVAGMMDMPLRRFWFANVLSAVFWAPAYLLPGYVVGAAVTRADTLDKLSEILMVFVVTSGTLGFFIAFTGELLRKKYKSNLALFLVASGFSLALTVLLRLWAAEGLDELQRELVTNLSLIQQSDLVAILHSLGQLTDLKLTVAVALFLLGGSVWRYGLHSIALLLPVLMVACGLTFWFYGDDLAGIQLAALSGASFWLLALIVQQMPWILRGLGYAGLLCIWSLIALVWIREQQLVLDTMIISLAMGWFIAATQPLLVDKFIQDQGEPR
ncbi:DedA family protein [Endozoicomonadaceae bacterium StTr2]